MNSFLQGKNCDPQGSDPKPKSQNSAEKLPKDNTPVKILPKYCMPKTAKILPKLPTLFLVKMMSGVAFSCTFVIKATIAHLLTIKRNLQKNLGICSDLIH